MVTPDKQMQQLKRYLDKHGISWRPTEEWSLMFQGNHPEGIYIDADKVPLPYIKKLSTLGWEYRGHYTSVYVYPKRMER